MNSSGATVLSHPKFEMSNKMTNHESPITNQIPFRFSLLRGGAEKRASATYNIRYSNFRASRGYTLIEMLISVTIFSGLLIIVLGTVASSSSSSAKVSLLRDKSQAARSLIDQISNDLRYVDLTANLNNEDQGFLIDRSARTSLTMALLLPGKDKDTGLIRKEYKIEQQFNNRLTLTLKEGRGCKRAGYLAFSACDQESEKTDLLSSAYTLGQETGFSSELSGLNVLEAEQQTPPISPFVSMTFSLKPVGLTTSCSLDPGTCYKVSTTVNMASK
ncbi:MAG: type II secretion system protein [Patescibacteria group bacterium]|mgnify:CR=1 FL=1